MAGSALLTRVGDIETMVAAGKRGAPLVVVGSAAKTGTIRIVSRRAAPITTTADFRGKLVGTPSTGGTSELTLDLVLASAGIPLDTVRRQVVGLAPGFAGAEVAIVFAVIGAIVGEYLGGNAGLGHLVIASLNTLDAPRLFAVIAFLTVLGAGLLGAVTFAKRLTIPWHDSQDSGN